MNNTAEKSKHDIFISYRRAGGDILGKLLYETLSRKKYSVFFDHESLSSGVFGDKIVETIRNAQDVLVLLSKNSLERCKNPDDWMFREISEAIGAQKNIILFFSEDFEMPSPQEVLNYPQEIQELVKYQGHRINIEHFDNIIKKLTTELKSKPVAYDEEDIAQAVSFLVNGGISELADGERNGLLDTVLTARYGSDLAKIVSSFIGSNVKGYQNIRHSFQYEISLDSSFNFGDIDIDRDKYFKLSENLSYNKQVRVGEVSNDFWVSFVKSLDELDDSLRNENFIFSENLLIDKVDLDKLCCLSKEEQLSFYTKNMRVRFNLNRKVLQPIDVMINDAGIFANYRISDSDYSEDEKKLDAKLAFSIPHRKTSSYFFVSISDPTYSPYIRMDYPDDEIDVEMIPFMNRSTSAANTKIYDGVREISFENEWVLPMSGAVFLITPRDDGQA